MRMDMNGFKEALIKTPVGGGFVYHFGDLAFEADYNKELDAVREMAWKAYEAGKICLTQRRRPDIPFGKGASFEYIATVREPQW